jgi:hypothetical protein
MSPFGKYMAVAGFLQAEFASVAAASLNIPRALLSRHPVKNIGVLGEKRYEALVSNFRTLARDWTNV